MRLEIRGHHFPGRTWQLPGRTRADDGQPCHNVHVGVQIRRDPADLVPGDSDTATWIVEITVTDVDGTPDFKGPAVQGKRGERFVYLTWGDVAGDGSFQTFRRAKLMLGHVDPAMIAAASEPGRRLVASVDLTDDCGASRCARLRPPALALSVE